MTTQTVWRDALPRPVQALHVGPHDGAHGPALRAGAAAVVPLLVVAAIGHIEWAPYAMFGAFPAVFGRPDQWRHRVVMQSQVGVSLAASIGLGSLVGLWSDDPRLLVVAGSLFSATISAVADVRQWRPAGSLFQLFGFSVGAVSTPESARDVAVAAGVCAASAAFAVAFGAFTTRRDATGLAAPARPSRRLIAVHAFQHLMSPLITGIVVTAAGWGHAYWAMVASVVPLIAPSTSAQVLRAGHRVVGTFAGLLVAAALLALEPHGVVLLVLLAALMAAAELLIARNYSLALLFITPVALLMGQVENPLPAADLVRDRAIETTVGVLVCVAVVIGTHVLGRYVAVRLRADAPAHSSRRHTADRSPSHPAAVRPRDAPEQPRPDAP